MLIPIDFLSYDFRAVRAFVVKGAANARRGGHAHRDTRQILQAIEGEIDLEFRYAANREVFRLIPAGPAILIERGVWCRQVYRGSHSMLAVYCDAPYDPEDYICTDMDVS